MKLSNLAVSLMLLLGLSSAVVPQWVEPGTYATYYMISGSWNGGTPKENSAAEAYTTHQVDDITEQGTTGTASIYNPHTGQTQTQQVICPEGGPACLGRFWLDPDDPAGSFKDETGATYTIGDRMDYSVAGRNWDAAIMSYQNPGSGVIYSVIYDTESGLVLAYSHDYPTQKTYLTLQETNAEF